MKRIATLVLVAGFVCALPLAALAGEGTGVERMGKGTVDTVTSPGQITKGISEDVEEKGAVTGTVTGTAKGSLKAGEQAVKGGADVGVGAVEAVTKPLTD
jgi:hypothetical protein